MEGKEYLYIIRFLPDTPTNSSGEWLRFDGHCEVLDTIELESSKESKNNSHLATLLSPHP